MCGLESVCMCVCVCAFLWAVSQERLIEKVGANISSLSTQRGPLFPLVQPSLWGSVPLSSPVPLHLTGPPLQAWSSAALLRWADEETRDPTFAPLTEWRYFHLDLYHSCSCASPMNICLIHCFFSIFPQEGAFALVFKSIHFPGEAVATRSATAMVSLNCNTQVSSFLSCSFHLLRWTPSHYFSSCQWTGARSLQFVVARNNLWCSLTVCTFKDKELGSLKSCGCPRFRDITKVFIKGYFNTLDCYSDPVYIILSRLRPRPKLIIPICPVLIVNECVVGFGQFCPAVKGTF